MFTDFKIFNCEICFEPQRITIEDFRGYMNPREVEECILSYDKKESNVKALVAMFSSSLDPANPDKKYSEALLKKTLLAMKYYRISVQRKEGKVESKLNRHKIDTIYRAFHGLKRGSELAKQRKLEFERVVQVLHLHLHKNTLQEHLHAWKLSVQRHKMLQTRKDAKQQRQQAKLERKTRADEEQREIEQKRREVRQEKARRRREKRASHEVALTPAPAPTPEPPPQRASTSRMRGHNVLQVLAVLAVLALLCVPAALATLGGARDAPMCERVVLGAWRACDGVEGLMCAAPVETPAAMGLATRFSVEDAAALEAGVQVQENGTLTAPVGAAGFTLLAETRDTASGALAYVQPVVVPNAPFNGLALTVQEAVLAGATAVGGLISLYAVDCLLNK